MSYQPPITFANVYNKPKKMDEDLLDLGYTYSDSNKSTSKNE
jgi:hypothetical protein